MSAFGQHRKFRPHARKTSDTQRSNPSKYQVLVISGAKHEVKKVVHIDGHTIRQAQEIKLLGMMQSSIVSLAPVFWMSRNVPPKERLRDIQKTAARETSKAGVFCRALNRQRVGTSQKIIPRERLTSQSRGGRLRKKANKENQPIFFFFSPDSVFIPEVEQAVSNSCKDLMLPKKKRKEKTSSKRNVLEQAQKHSRNKVHKNCKNRKIEMRMNCIISMHYQKASAETPGTWTSNNSVNSNSTPSLCLSVNTQ